MNPRDANTSHSIKGKAIIIFCSEDQAEEVEHVLDVYGVCNWTHFPAVQSRCSGFLQDVVRSHPSCCCAIWGFASSENIQAAVRKLVQARTSGKIAAECMVFTWATQQEAAADLHLDPVCETVVDAETAENTEYGGEAIYFCSARCREAFLAEPTFYLEHRDHTNRVDRRDLVSRPTGCRG